MKAGREHRVPLPDAAVALLRGLAGDTPKPTDLLFPGSGGKPLSNMSLTAVLRRMDRSNLTAHGFRSTFRDWAAESTMCEPDVVEMALAHAVSNKVEAAYRRGDLFEKRRKLMSDWAAFCAGAASPATKIHNPQEETSRGRNNPIQDRKCSSEQGSLPPAPHTDGGPDTRDAQRHRCL